MTQQRAREIYILIMKVIGTVLIVGGLVTVCPCSWLYLRGSQASNLTGMIAPFGGQTEVAHLQEQLRRMETDLFVGQLVFGGLLPIALGWLLSLRRSPFVRLQYGPELIPSRRADTQVEAAADHGSDRNDERFAPPGSSGRP